LLCRLTQTYIFFYNSLIILVLICLPKILLNIKIFNGKYFNTIFNDKYYNTTFSSKYPYTVAKPYDFVSLRLESGLDISSIVTEVNALLPQLAGFIDQFNNIVTQSSLNVITDSVGNMSIDVPHSMSDIEAQNISKRISVIDRLITTHGNSINDLFQKGLSLESKLKANNPNYVSELSDQLAQFKKLNASYKH
jgi:hypothetical protein